MTEKRYREGVTMMSNCKDEEKEQQSVADTGSQQISHCSCPALEEEKITKHRLNIYKIYRDYIKHEDNLVHQRISWVLTIHGFLYATYGLTVQKKFEIINRQYEFIFYKSDQTDKNRNIQQQSESTLNSVNHLLLDKNTDLLEARMQLEVLLIFIALVGFAISVHGIKAINGAHIAIHNLHKFFHTQHIQHSRDFRNMPIFDKDASQSTPTLLRQIITNVKALFGFDKSEMEYKSDDTYKYDRDDEGYLVKYKNSGYVLPGIFGGGLRYVTRNKEFASGVIPTILMLSWIIAFAFQVGAIIYKMF